MRVATIYNAGKHSKVGPAKNIARLYANKELFLDKGIELLGPFVPDQGIGDLQSYERSFKFKLKQFVKRCMKKSRVGNLLSLRMTQIRLSRMALEEYWRVTQDNVDLVIFRDFISAHEYLRLGGTRPYVLVMHNDGTPDMFFSDSPFEKLSTGVFRKMLDAWFEEVFHKASGLLFLSKQAEGRFHSRYPEVSCAMGIYHQGLERPASPCPLECANRDLVVFVSVGTVCKRKNQRGIIEAFSQMSDPAALLVIVGEGEDLPYCRQLVKELGIDDKVIFTGSLENVGDALSVADVFVSASFDEGVPNAAVEAMAYGLPLVLSDVGSCKTLIENENGILVDTSVTQLQEAMLAMLENPELRRSSGEGSLELFESCYRVETMCLEHCDMYLQALSN